ncbi:2-oxo-4-hydroxy-4-carboxy-5-ureidoimidazoline decarboxylase [Microbacterium hibisci]|uniref:2-oxo-4-hydroxy-4-carboxy-5-ureidoimidazoline decarboxylase n=1 Tax=Microbacterium hibisci TaxID=2036000 RepID=UPI001944B0DD|nr:2-oxo-4-hydroxy-4-carboxy-5-ureidoimidazoline decarboxylase [Microbacterium hibisci]
MKLEAFNRLDAGAARDVVRPCVDIDRWVEALVAGRPYADRRALRETARTAAAPWTADEIDRALARHPRLGDRVRGTSAEASWSRSEQAGLGTTPGDTDTAAALAAGNRAYEERFSRVFLIRAAGRSAPEILAALEARLAHTEDEEIAVVADELRQIALLRLEGIIEP